jgi:hypothetical protein
MGDISDDLDAWVIRTRKLCGLDAPEQPPRPKRGHGPTSEQLIGRTPWGATSGHRGVYKVGSGRFVAKVTRDKKQWHIGTFDTEAQAAEAVAKYLEAESR